MNREYVLRILRHIKYAVEDEIVLQENRSGSECLQAFIRILGQYSNELKDIIQKETQ